MNPEADAALPGEELVNQGLRDLAQGKLSERSLLVLSAAPRLRALWIEIPKAPVTGPYEHRLYELLEERLGSAAHSHYNSLIRRIVSYARARERERGTERH